MDAQIKHPVSKTLFATVAYTWSHNTTNLAGNGVIDPYNLNRFHGNTESLNFPQSAAITLIYTLPFFEHSKGIGNILAGGWRFSDITTLRSGTSLSPGVAGSNMGLAARPLMAAGNPSTNGPKTWKPSVCGTTCSWFNTAAFIDPTAHIGGISTNPLNSTLYYGLYGNAQTGIIRGPGQEIYNMALFKEFHPYRASVIEFRAEAFNAFNHANPSNPGTAISNSSTSKISGTSDPRILELALRIKF